MSISVRSAIGLAIVLGVIGWLVWLWSRPLGTGLSAPLTQRDRRAWLILGLVFGMSLLYVHLPTSRLSAVVGAAQGLVFCSLGLPPRGQRIGFTIAALAVIAAFVLALLGFLGFSLAPEATA